MRADPRELAHLDREKRRRDALTPNAIRVLGPLCELYVSRLRALGSKHATVLDLLTVSDALLDEMGAGRDIPAEVAEGMLTLLEDRLEVTA